MLGAPSVRFPVGRSRWLARLLLFIWLSGVLSLAWAWPQPSWRWALGSAVLLLAGAGAVHFWLRMPRGELSWDGRVWRSTDGLEADGAPVVRLDWQDWMLVQLHGGAWLWLEAASDPHAWRALRRALYARTERGPRRAELTHE